MPGLANQYWILWGTPPSIIYAVFPPVAPPPASGPFPTRTAAEAALKKGEPWNIKTPKQLIPKNPLTAPLTGLMDVGDFFHRLTEKETWVRVGEVVLGGILVYAGVRALSHGSAVAGAGARQSVTKPVRKAAKTVTKVAAPEARLATRAVAKRAAPKTTARVSAHRARAAKYGARKPYQAPPPRKPIRHEVVRTSHIIHHKAGAS